MQVVGSDQENQELTLEFDRDRCVWELTKAEKELHNKKIDPESKETAKDKVKRLLLKDALNGNFPEKAGSTLEIFSCLCNKNAESAKTLYRIIDDKENIRYNANDQKCGIRNFFTL